ncbi:MAG: hypothetical protein Q9192_006623, partial [Flavoplaca navasiana]
MAVPMTPESARKPVPGESPTLPAPESGNQQGTNPTVYAGPPPYSEQERIWDAARETLPNNIAEKPKLIAVMGPTGTGKSTFISKLAGREMKIGHHLHS